MHSSRQAQAVGSWVSQERASLAESVSGEAAHVALAALGSEDLYLFVADGPALQADFDLWQGDGRVREGLVPTPGAHPEFQALVQVRAGATSHDPLGAENSQRMLHSGHAPS